MTAGPSTKRILPPCARVPRISRALERQHANAFVANDDLFAHARLVHWFAISAVLRPVDDDGDIHFNVFYVYPLAVQAHLGRQVGGRVEPGGQDSMLFYNSRLHVAAMQKDGAKLLEFRYDEFQCCVSGGLDLEADITCLGFAGPDAHLLHGKVAAAIHDDIPRSRQCPGVDDVTGEFNYFIWHRFVPYGCLVWVIWCARRGKRAGMGRRGTWRHAASLMEAVVARCSAPFR